MTQQENRRKFPRFSNRTLAGTKVNLEPCPPLFGDAVSGCLVDLSAGGMAVLAPDLIPKKVFMKMSMVLPNGFSMSSVIAVRHVAKQKYQHNYLHGIEFLNPSPEMIDEIQRMASEILTTEKPRQASERVPMPDSPPIQRPTAEEIENFFRDAA